MKHANEHKEAVEGGKITRSNVIAIRRALNADMRRLNGWSVSKTAPKLSGEKLYELCEQIETANPLVCGQLHDSGLKLLRSKRYAKRLARYSDIIAEIKEFRLMGFYQAHSNSNSTPIYRAIAKNGKGFNFTCQPWQSGGNGPEIFFE
jgi:hypothetical protein